MLFNQGMRYVWILEQSQTKLCAVDEQLQTCTIQHKSMSQCDFISRLFKCPPRTESKYGTLILNLRPQLFFKSRDSKIVSYSLQQNPNFVLGCRLPQLFQGLQISPSLMSTNQNLQNHHQSPPSPNLIRKTSFTPYQENNHINPSLVKAEPKNQQQTYPSQFRTISDDRLSSLMSVHPHEILLDSSAEAFAVFNTKSPSLLSYSNKLYLLSLLYPQPEKLLLGLSSIWCNLQAKQETQVEQPHDTATSETKTIIKDETTQNHQQQSSTDYRGPRGGRTKKRRPSLFKNANKYFLKKLRWAYDKFGQILPKNSRLQLEELFRIRSVGFDKLNRILQVQGFRQLFRRSEVLQRFDQDQPKRASADASFQESYWKNKVCWLPVIKHVLEHDCEFRSWSKLYNQITGRRRQ